MAAPKAATKVISRAEPLADWKAGNLEQRKVVQWAELKAGKWVALWADWKAE